MQTEPSHEHLAALDEEPSATGWSQQLRQMLGMSGEGTRLAVRLYGRTLEVTFSPAAMAAAAALTSPLTVELELYFSCLVRKAVRFHAALPRAAGFTGFTHPRARSGAPAIQSRHNSTLFDGEPVRCPSA